MPTTQMDAVGCPEQPIAYEQEQQMQAPYTPEDYPGGTNGEEMKTNRRPESI